MDRITSKVSYFVGVFSFRGFEDIVLNLKLKIEIIKNGLKYDLKKRIWKLLTKSAPLKTQKTHLQIKTHTTET